MKASAINARPSTLSATCRMSHALRPAGTSVPGLSPLKTARPTSPVASGEVKNDTAEPRNRRSLASCSSTRQNASMESAGPRPTSVSWERATTCAAAPAQGNAIASAREVVPRYPMNGANTSPVARAYSVRAIRWSVTITTKIGRARLREPGRLLGGHLLDQAYRKTSIESWVHDLNQKPGGGAFARVYDHEDRAHFLGRRSDGAFGRFEDFE